MENEKNIKKGGNEGGLPQSREFKIFKNVLKGLVPVGFALKFAVKELEEIPVNDIPEAMLSAIFAFGIGWFLMQEWKSPDKKSLKKHLLFIAKGVVLLYCTPKVITYLNREYGDSVLGLFTVAIFSGAILASLNSFKALSELWNSLKSASKRGEK